eukprot:13217482-Ditylum_brightwellii.AAC.1
MEAMKIDLTITLRKELKTMVTESTKAAVENVRAEMKDYMKNKPPPPETPPGNQVEHKATGQVTLNLPHGIPQQ